VAGGALAPAFPPIHPLAPIGVRELFPHRSVGLQQILLRRKKIIRRVQHAAAQTLSGKVD
jgi:hypothetical protein